MRAGTPNASMPGCVAMASADSSSPAPAPSCQLPAPSLEEGMRAKSNHRNVYCVHAAGKTRTGPSVATSPIRSHVQSRSWGATLTGTLGAWDPQLPDSVPMSAGMPRRHGGGHGKKNNNVGDSIAGGRHQRRLVTMGDEPRRWPAVECAPRTRAKTCVHLAKFTSTVARRCSCAQSHSHFSSRARATVMASQAP